MSIRVNIPHLLQYLTDNRKMAEVSGSTVGECLKHLVKQFPPVEEALFDEHGKLNSYLDIYVNEESAYPEELAKPVRSGDELDIIFMIDGG